MRVEMNLDQFLADVHQLQDELAELDEEYAWCS